MTYLATTVLLGVALVVPHTLRLHRSEPAAAVAVWAAVLGLRAAIVVAAAAMALVWFPATAAFSALSHWCWHEVIPGASAHIAVNGHAVGDTTAILPAALLAGALVWLAARIRRATRRVSRLLRRATIGRGPGRSLVLRDGQVLIAAAGIRRPEVVVSAGALVALDDEELAASLDHERGHIQRRHRFVLLLALTLRALARPLPGTAHVYRQLAFQLERDADAFAVRRRHSPAALASAICKAAMPGPYGIEPHTALRGSGPTAQRVQELLQGAPAYHQAPSTSRAHRRVAVGLLAVLAGLVISAPVAAHQAEFAAAPAHRCDD